MRKMIVMGRFGCRQDPLSLSILLLTQKKKAAAAATEVERGP